jgi:hypothetical protein
MVLLRILGLWLVLLATVALVVDGTKSMSGDGEWVVTELGEQWRAFDAKSVDALRDTVSRDVHPMLWDPVLTTILATPTWAVLGLLGIFVFWLGRKRERIEVYTN